MEIALTIISVILFGLFMLGAITNLWCWVRPREKDKHNPSIIPWIPGIVGCVSFAIFPLYPLIKLSWLPLILDVGCLPYTIGASTYLLHDWWIHHPRFKVMELHSNSPDFELEVNLYRTGRVTFRMTNLRTILPQPTEPHWSVVGNAGKWTEKGDELILNTYHGIITYRKIEPTKYIWISSNKKNYFDNIDLEVFTAKQ